MIKTDKILVIDCEATIHAKGNPFSESNKLMCVGTLFGDDVTYHSIEHTPEPYGDTLRTLRSLFEQAELVVGFNIKYDLHWLRRYIPDLPIRPVFDCQLAEFLLSDQQSVYPSLELCSERYNLPPKFVDIEELWNAGVNTNEIPREILERRVLSDVRITWDLYKKQRPIIESQGKEALFTLQCDDLLVLEEMEFNGMLFDHTEALRLGVAAEEKIKELNAKLGELVPFPHINWNSNNHLSAILYGGFINYPTTRSVARTLKSGKLSVREVKDYGQQVFPRLCKPLDKTEVARTKDLTDADLERLNEELRQNRKPQICRCYHVAEPILRSLPAKGLARQIINLCLDLSEIAKLRDTYYLGIPKLVDEMGWRGGLIHGQLNQCVARTGRLSSSAPNLQNFATAIKGLFRSRYGEAN